MSICGLRQIYEISQLETNLSRFAKTLNFATKDCLCQQACRKCGGMQKIKFAAIDNDNQKKALQTKEVLQPFSWNLEICHRNLTVMDGIGCKKGNL